MKVLPTSRILLVDSRKDRREATRHDLMKFGLGEVLEAASLHDATSPTWHENVDLMVVRADDPDHLPANPYRDGGGIPAILVVELAPQQLARACAQGGYEVALGSPLASRTLYRRIGSVLQQARRTGRALSRAPADDLGGKSGSIHAS